MSKKNQFKFNIFLICVVIFNGGKTFATTTDISTLTTVSGTTNLGSDNYRLVDGGTLNITGTLTSTGDSAVLTFATGTIALTVDGTGANVGTLSSVVNAIELDNLESGITSSIFNINIINDALVETSDLTDTGPNYGIAIGNTNCISTVWLL